MANELILKKYWFNYCNPNIPSKETDDITLLAKACALTFVSGAFCFTFNNRNVYVDLEFSPFIFKDIKFDSNGNPIQKDVDKLKSQILRYAESAAFNKISATKTPVL